MDNQGKRYDAIAEGFASMRDSFYMEQKYLDILMQQIQPGSHILDVGCGSGFPIAHHLIEKGFKVTGVDGSQELLKIAETKVPLMHRILGDVRTVILQETYDAIVEWWCLFHIPLDDHALMIQRFSQWLKPNGMLEFTSGDEAFSATNSDMLNQELSFYSQTPEFYETQLKQNGFKLLLKESDQPNHLVWIARKEG